jgi:hypothetical protein
MKVEKAEKSSEFKQVFGEDPILLKKLICKK